VFYFFSVRNSAVWRECVRHTQHMQHARTTWASTRTRGTYDLRRHLIKLHMSYTHTHANTSPVPRADYKRYD
jgi:hypothetical protein